MWQKELCTWFQSRIWTWENYSGLSGGHTFNLEDPYKREAEEESMAEEDMAMAQ